MSLINDALKRAKQARPQTPPLATSNLPLRPVEPGPQAARHGIGLLLPVSLALVALLTLLLLWELSRRESPSAPVQQTRPLAVAARTLPSAEPAPAKVEPPSSPSPDSTAISAKSATGSGIEGTAAAPTFSTSPTTAPAGTNSTSTRQDDIETNAVPVTEPAPPPLRLQSIIFNPRRPSAMISGRIVFVGDYIRDLRVAAIRQDYVSLIGTGRTNILSLEP